jgi:hypothetical protein
MFILIWPYKKGALFKRLKSERYFMKLSEVALCYWPDKAEGNAVFCRR